MLRKAGRARVRAWRLGVPLVLALAGTLFAVSSATARGSDLRAAESIGLADLIAQENRRVQSLSAGVETLRRDVDRLTRAQGGQDVRVTEASNRARGLEPAAGLTPMTGPALTVTLDDAPRPPDGATLPGNPAPDDLVVHQQDLQAVVNALWAGGAQGVQLMDQRVISTSAVRCVGNVLILQGRTYSPPYVVTGVGDVAAMRAALDRSREVALYRQYVDAFGLRYDVQARDSVTLPAYQGGLGLRYARVVRS